MDYQKIYQENKKQRTNLVNILISKGAKIEEAKNIATKLQSMEEEEALSFLTEALKDKQNLENLNEDSEKPKEE